MEIRMEIHNNMGDNKVLVLGKRKHFQVILLKTPLKKESRMDMDEKTV